MHRAEFPHVTLQSSSALVGRQGLEPRIFRLRAGYIAAYVCDPQLVRRKGVEPLEPEGICFTDSMRALRI